MNKNQTPQGPVYSVDWQSEASGKRVGATKRRVRWRFGFANLQALDQGLKGVDCRGEEHEVVLVWSLTSGKRLVIVDGREVHFSTGRRTESKFETSFSMFGNHIFKVVAFAAPPLSSTPGFRQYDLQLDGMSFDTFPKIFELGLRSSPHVEYEYSTTYSEPRHFAMSPQTSRFQYEERRAPVPITPEVNERPVVKNVAPAQVPTPPVVQDILASPNSGTNHDDLLSMHSAPQLPYQPPPVERPQPYQQQQAPAPVHSTPAQTYYPPQQPQVTPQNRYYQQSPHAAMVVDEFAPVPPPPRTFQDVSNEILSAYTPDPSIPALMYTPHYSNEAYQASSGVATNEEEQATTDVTPDKFQKPVLKPTMEPVSIVEMEERDQPPLSAMQKAVKALVNLEDITETLETPEQAKATRNKELNQPAKSKPLPPSKPAWNIGLRPSLGDIKQHAQPKAPPQKEVMRTHAFDPAAVHAGMMVVYGSSIPAASGFGAGVHASHYNHNGYFQQQQQHAMYAAY